MGAVSEGTILAGSNPLHDPLALFILQALLIIVVARVLGVGLAYLRQPTVIAEVIGGILLGPSALGQVSAFREAVFPQSSLPMLSLVANIGLILFLFLVGLELDPRSLRENYKQSLVISLAGVVVPFALSVGASKVLFDFIMVPDHDADVLAHELAIKNGNPLKTVTLPLPPFSSFLVFTGVAMSITAFPVLARILAERKLLGTTVGTATLTAAAVGDATAWCLLVLVVALITNPSNAIMALWVFLVVVGWSLFLWFAIRPIFVWLVDRSPHSETVSSFAIFFTFCVIWVSSWFMQAVGVHAIFGAFLVGIIVPHEHGFAIQLTEKIEDLVSVVFLPLYFAYSGLNTRIDQLNDGISWAMVLFVTVVACIGKILGCGLSGKLTGLNWRESWAVGVLMNTKGLVELIVLNLGLQGGVISPRVFTIMVMMALITTFSTVPLVSVIYPQSYYAKGHTKSVSVSKKDDEEALQQTDKLPKAGVLICLPNIHCVPAMITITQMMQHLNISALRLLPLTERTSVIMRAHEHQQTIRSDPILNVFRTFGQLSRVGVTADFVVCQQEDFSENIINAAETNSVSIIIVPYIPISHTPRITYFDEDKEHIMLDQVRHHARCSVAVFIDRGFGVSSTGIYNMHETEEVQFPGYNQRIFVVFVGGKDDREALRFVKCFVEHHGLKITVFKIQLEHPVAVESTQDSQDTALHVSSEDEELDLRVLAELTRFDNVKVEELSGPTIASQLSEHTPTSTNSVAPPSPSSTMIPVGPITSRAGKAMVGLLKQHFTAKLGAKDLVVVGQETEAKLGNGLLRTYLESENCVSSVVIVSSAKDGRGLGDEL